MGREGERARKKILTTTRALFCSPSPRPTVPPPSRPPPGRPSPGPPLPRVPHPPARRRSPARALAPETPSPFRPSVSFPRRQRCPPLPPPWTPTAPKRPSPRRPCAPGALSFTVSGREGGAWRGGGGGGGERGPAVSRLALHGGQPWGGRWPPAAAPRLAWAAPRLPAVHASRAPIPWVGRVGGCEGCPSSHTRRARPSASAATRARAFFFLAGAFCWERRAGRQTSSGLGCGRPRERRRVAMPWTGCTAQAAPAQGPPPGRVRPLGPATQISHGKPREGEGGRAHAPLPPTRAGPPSRPAPSPWPGSGRGPGRRSGEVWWVGRGPRPGAGHPESAAHPWGGRHAHTFFFPSLTTCPLPTTSATRLRGDRLPLLLLLQGPRR